MNLCFWQKARTRSADAPKTRRWTDALTPEQKLRLAENLRELVDSKRVIEHRLREQAAPLR